MRDLLGKEEVFVRDLNVFQASSVLAAEREWCRVVSRVFLCSGVKGVGGLLDVVG